MRLYRRAIGKAGDLAHGLKTPLAILSNEADRLEDGGDPDLAAVLSQQISLMKRQVDYHLAHARAAASGTATGARASVSESAEGLVRALRRLHAGRHLSIDATVCGRALLPRSARGSRRDARQPPRQRL